MPTARDTAQTQPADLMGGWSLAFHLPTRAKRLAHPTIRSALWNQVSRGALNFAGLTAVIGALAGFFTIVTVETSFGLGVTLGVRVMEALVLGQLAGFVSALVLVTGAGTAATFELGLMRHQGELRTLRLIGIDPTDLLVLPRVVGFAFALFVLTFAFQAAAVLGGFALAAIFTQISFAQHAEALIETLQPSSVVISSATSLVLGAILGVLVCHHGLNAGFSPSRAAHISRELLSRSLIAIVIVHGGAALLVP